MIGAKETYFMSKRDLRSTAYLPTYLSIRDPRYGKGAG